MSTSTLAQAEATQIKRTITPMKVTLEPLSHPELASIQIDQSLFAIGRHEATFATMAPEVLNKLSRRHARIFSEAEQVYIADLGSLNGTQVNDRPVSGEPLALADGDVLLLGGEVTFRVVIQVQSPPSTVAALGTTLTLTPAASDAGTDPIVISSFPLLITRTDPMFGRYKENFPDDVSRLSRRHAVLSLQDDEVFLEDLNSINGTLVNKSKLDERAKRLKNGDVITFGTQRFSYRVQLDTPVSNPVTDGTVLMINPNAGQAAQNPRTTFVSSPSSFLEIFCDQESASEDPIFDDEGNRNSGASAHNAVQGKAGRQGKLRRLFSATPGRRLTSWSVLVLCLVFLATGTGLYLNGKERRDIKRLYDAGDYAGSLSQASRYLAHSGTDTEAHAWAVQAAIKALLPQWLEQMNAGQYASAKAHLLEYSELSRDLTQVQEITRILNWATAIQKHISARGGPDAPIEVFTHQSIAQTLLEPWNTRAARFQQILTQVTAIVPTFEPMHINILSNLRMLKNEDALFGKAISNLVTSISHHLRGNNHLKIRPMIQEFRRKYPRVSGVEALDQDAALYETLAHHMTQLNLIQVVDLHRRDQFTTALFIERVNAWLSTDLPSARVIQTYDQAAAAWQQGDHEQSRALLQELIHESWSQLAIRRLARQEQIVAAYEDLEKNTQATDYPQRLLGFRATLRATEDQYFLNLLQPRFLDYKAQILDELSASSKTIQADWKAYTDAGGIPAMMRVENGLSQSFKTQARRLKAAFRAVDIGINTFTLLQETPSALWQQLHNDIVNESTRQRRSFEDLHLVLDATLLRKKLDQLPILQEPNA